VGAPDGRLEGKHALVTGASRGIGLAIAQALAAEGAALTLTARDADALAMAAQLCETAGSPSVAVEVCDLTDREELDELATTVAAAADIVVNNAGIAPSAPLEKSDDDLWDLTLDLDAFAPFALCRAALPAMAERGWGRVVNVASSAALEGYAYTSVYVAAKHALLGLTRALSAEAAQRWRDADLSLNAVCPGFVDTDIVAESARRIAATTDLDEATAKERLAAMNPGGKLLTPEEVAAAVVALILETPATTKGQALRLPES
jgi:NAD(P)-dependent dehydrogenase (short-subunit alcohol dehydrogenase family)